MKRKNFELQEIVRLNMDAINGNKGRHAVAIAELAEKYSIEEVLDFFEKHKEYIRRKSNNIKVIGVYYRRMYDGGVERVISNLIPIWMEMGYRVVLFTDERPNEKDYSYPSDVKRIIIPSPEKLLGRLQGIENGVVSEKIDVFIDNGWTSESILWEMLLVKSLHIPFVLYAHGHFTALYSMVGEYVLNSYRAFALCDKIIALSAMNARFYELCGCNVTLVENPIPESLKQVKIIPKNEKQRILWIGRIADGKRFDDAIKIFCKVKEKIPNAELDVVGTGEENVLEEKKLLCESKKIGKSVHFHGYQQNVSMYYQQASLMLMTSEKEGYPTVLLESKAYGLPCVMYSLPYLSLVQDGKGIRTANIGDIEQMAKQVVILLQNRNIRDKLSNEARESFVSLCKYDFVEKWKEIILDIESTEGKKEDVVEEYQQDAMMLTMLLKNLQIGVRAGLEKSLDYKLGKMLLKYPRVLMKIIRKYKKRANCR